MLLLTKRVLFIDSLTLLTGLLLNLVLCLILLGCLLFHCYLFDLICCLLNRAYQLFQTDCSFDFL